MNIPDTICLSSDQLETIVDKLVGYIKQVHKLEAATDWIPEAEAMSLLNVSSKTTMFTYRSEGKIKYSQMGKKILLYSRSSINEFISNHSKNTF